jgi:hypothetical protein
MPTHVHAWIMSPQAHRRLLATMHTVELDDLASEIVAELIDAHRIPAEASEQVHAIILETMTRDY